METNSTEPRGGVRPLSTLQAGIAALPFLAFGISSMVSKLEYFQTTPASLPLWQILLIHPFLVFNWLMLIGLAIGISKGFPRWAYPFLGWTLLFAWWWSDMGFYGHSLDWKIWLPLLGAFLAGLAVRRSWQPLRALLSGMWRDWTLLSLGVYMLYAFLFMSSDENHHPYLLVFIAAGALAFGAGAWGYFRAASPLRRVLALMGALFVAAVLGGINSATWDYRAYYGLPESAQKVSIIGIIFAVVVVLLMLGNGLLARWRLKRGSRMNGM